MKLNYLKRKIVEDDFNVGYRIRICHRESIFIQIYFILKLNFKIDEKLAKVSKSSISLFKMDHIGKIVLTNCKIL